MIFSPRRHPGRNVGKVFSPFLAGTEEHFTIHYTCLLCTVPLCIVWHYVSYALLAVALNG